MKKSIQLLLTGSLLVSLLTGCGGAAPAAGSGQKPADPPSASSAKPAAFTMQVGHAQATTSPRHLALLGFKEMVEQQTNGGVVVEIYPAGQLGNETEMTEAVSMGTLQAVRGGELEYLPKITALSLPMLCDNMEEVHKLCYSDYVSEMLGSVETEHGMKVLAVGDDSGFRQITNNVRPIHTPADMKGLKMRTVLEVIDISMKSFGATTVSVPFTDLYMALKTGVADGQENPLALIDNQKFYEVQKYCSIVDYMICAEVMYVNLDWFHSLPADYQAVLSDCARKMMDETSRIVEQENIKYIENIKNNGCEVYELTPEERETFREPAEKVWKQYIDSGRMSREDLDAMLACLGKSVDW